MAAPKPSSPNFIGPTFPETRKMQTAPLSSGPSPFSPNFIGPTFPETRDMQAGPMKPADPMKPSQPAQMPMQPQVDGNAMASLFATMGANQLQQQREYLADRRIKGVRRDMSGNVIDEATGMTPAGANPFKNGTFQTRDQRIEKEQAVFGGDPDKTFTAKNPGYLDRQGVADQMRKQGQAFGGVTIKEPSQDPSPFKGHMMPLKNAKGQVIGEQYMINPGLADDQKYKQANFAEVRFGKSTPGPRDPTVPVITDETGIRFYPRKDEDISQEQNDEIDAVRRAKGARAAKDLKYKPAKDTFLPEPATPKQPKKKK